MKLIVDASLLRMQHCVLKKAYWIGISTRCPNWATIFSSNCCFCELVQDKYICLVNTSIKIQESLLSLILHKNKREFGQVIIRIVKTYYFFHERHKQKCSRLKRTVSLGFVQMLWILITARLTSDKMPFFLRTKSHNSQEQEWKSPILKGTKP